MSSPSLDRLERLVLTEPPVVTEDTDDLLDIKHHKPQTRTNPLPSITVLNMDARSPSGLLQRVRLRVRKPTGYGEHYAIIGFSDKTSANSKSGCGRASSRLSA
jgi:hypothetical protein